VAFGSRNQPARWVARSCQPGSYRRLVASSFLGSCKCEVVKNVELARQDAANRAFRYFHSNSTFLCSIGLAAIRWPNPLLRGTDATFSIPPGSPQVSLPAMVGACRRRLGRLACRQWLHPSLAQKFNPHATPCGCRPSTPSSYGGCQPNPPASPRLLEDSPPDLSFSSNKRAEWERYLAANGLIADRERQELSPPRC